MNDPSDKLFHDWVRQTLREYHPDPEPTGWERLRRARRGAHLRRWATGLGLVLLLVGSWAAWESQRAQPAALTEPVTPARVAGSGLGSESAHPANVVRSAHESVTKPNRPVRRIRPRSSPATAPETERTLVPSLALRQGRPVLLATVAAWERRALRPLDVPPADEIAIRQQLATGDFGADSTSLRVLARNLRRWPDAVVVCDLTSSMAPYTTQLFAWFRKAARNPAVKGFVFFTDCDSLGQETRPGGPPGQFFVTRERDPIRALPTLLAATRNTRANVGDAENDGAALRFAQRTFPEAKHLILVADNGSPVKDRVEFEGLTKPVHVVLCGPTIDSTVAFQPDYETLARRTRGSLHTLEDDLDPTRLTADTWLRVGSRYYRYDARRQRFRLSRFGHRPDRLLGLFWW